VDLFTWSPDWPVCLVVGHEREGISRGIAPLLDTVIRIPMLGRKGSLNVATAAGVALYELLRLRLYGRT
jgi:tRNA G18 (ribose-2'-O)-methylase SpoU